MSLRDFDIIEDLKPIGGGWRYMQAQRHGDGFQRIPTTGSAQTGRALVEMVKRYRISEGILVGDPEQDVADYIKKVSPNNDRFRGKSATLGKPRPANFVPLIQRIREWVDRVGPQKPLTLTPHEASERAQICIACQQNVRWKTTCGECNETIDYLAYTMRGVVDHPLDEALHGCRLHDLHLPAAVFLDRDFLPCKSSEAPAQCWLPDQPK